MRKLLWLIVCLMTMVAFTSCSTNYLATANYEVCYPDGTRSYEDSVVVSSVSVPNVMCFSIGGTNYVSAMETNVVTDGTTAKNAKKITIIASSTAPIRLLNYNVRKLKKQRPKSYNDW